MSLNLDSKNESKPNKNKTSNFELFSPNSVNTVSIQDTDKELYKSKECGVATQCEIFTNNDVKLNTESLNNIFSATNRNFVIEEVDELNLESNNGSPKRPNTQTSIAPKEITESPMKKREYQTVTTKRLEENDTEDSTIDVENGEKNKTSSIYDSKLDKKNSTKIAKKSKIVVNLTECRYKIVEHVCKKMLGWKVIDDDDETRDWDIYLTDHAVRAEFLGRMNCYQKVNHFPGTYNYSRKDMLARNLKRLKKQFPQHYKFFPDTYILPAEKSEFVKKFEDKRKLKTYIVKPEAAAQGRGIFLIQKPNSIPENEPYVVQKYQVKPYLIDKLKFDLRIYVLLAGIDPLRIFIYEDGLARFATKNYHVPTKKNQDNLFMHLTNYSINKNHANFKQNTDTNPDEGHKRSQKSVFEHMKGEGVDVEELWEDIKKMVLKTLCSVQPILKHHYKASQPEDYYQHMCFEILGFDFIINSKKKPIIQEVNHSPSFNVDSPIDKKVKMNMIHDALKIMNVSTKMKKKLMSQSKREQELRVLTGKRIKYTAEEKAIKLEAAQLERDEWIYKNLGGWQVVYPYKDKSQETEPYDDFMEAARQIYLGNFGVSKINQKIAKQREEEKNKQREEEKGNKSVCMKKNNKSNIFQPSNTKPSLLSNSVERKMLKNVNFSNTTDAVSVHSNNAEMITTKNTNYAIKITDNNNPKSNQTSKRYYATNSVNRKINTNDQVNAQNFYYLNNPNIMSRQSMTQHHDLQQAFKNYKSVEKASLTQMQDRMFAPDNKIQMYYTVETKDPNPLKSIERFDRTNFEHKKVTHEIREHVNKVLYVDSHNFKRDPAYNKYKQMTRIDRRVLENYRPNVYHNQNLGGVQNKIIQAANVRNNMYKHDQLMIRNSMKDSYQSQKNTSNSVPPENKPNYISNLMISNVISNNQNYKEENQQNSNNNLVEKKHRFNISKASPTLTKIKY